MDKAKSRLRKSFKYTTDTSISQTYSSASESDEDDQSPALDEQEQETLISNLRSSDTKINALYVKVFTLLPLGIIPSFLYFMLSPSATKAGGAGLVRLLCLLAMTSLLATGFEMWFVVPYQDVEHGGNEGGNGSDRTNRDYDYDDGGVRLHMAARKTRKVPFSDVEIDEDGPLGRTLPFLNMGICLLLSIAGLGLRSRKDVPAGFWAFLFLPAVVLGVVGVVRRSMRDVQEGIGELEKRRYGYKGA